MDTISAKALAGWTLELENGEVFGGYPPEPTDITVQAEKFAPFVAHVFVGVRGVDIRVLKLLAMTLLMRHDDVVADIKMEPTGKYEDPINHPFVHVVESARVKCGLSEENFNTWKEQARQGFLTRNRAALPLTFHSEVMENFMMDGRTVMGSFQSLVRLNGASNGTSLMLRNCCELRCYVTFSCLVYEQP